MNDSTFNPDAFLTATYTEASSTSYEPVPEGEYIGLITKVEPGEWASRDGTRSGKKLTVRWRIDDPALTEKLGRQPELSQSVMLDTTPEGTLDMRRGRNISFGRLREATGLNTPGQPFSLDMLTGRVAKVQVTHRTDGDRIFDEVKYVAKAS